MNNEIKVYDLQNEPRKNDLRNCMNCYHPAASHDFGKHSDRQDGTGVVGSCMVTERCNCQSLRVECHPDEHLFVECSRGSAVTIGAADTSTHKLVKETEDVQLECITCYKMVRFKRVTKGERNPVFR